MIVHRDGMEGPKDSRMRIAVARVKLATIVHLDPSPRTRFVLC